MQNQTENLKEFSPPCVDNSTKTDEKSNENQLSSGVTNKSTEKSSDFQGNSSILPSSTVNLSSNSADDDKTTSSVCKTDRSQEKDAASNENASKPNENIGESNESAGEGKVILTYESQIERDFGDFSIIYPNISKERLLSNESLRLFAEGKENKQLSVVYATYCKFANIIANDAILQEKSRAFNAESSSGSLSSSQGANKAYFTKEQVKAMSPEEIKQNYDLIRQSQISW